MKSPYQWYQQHRNEFKKSNAEIESFCRQVLSLIDENNRIIHDDLKRQEKQLRERQMANVPQEPWDDAPGVML